MCDRAGIMYLGNMVEQGQTDELVDDPKHPYTEALFDAVPDVELGDERRRANATGEVPSPRNPPAGCRYHPRCAHIIPPDDWTGSQEAFRRAYQFRLKVRRGELGPESVEEGVADSPEDLVAHGLTLDVPDEYQSRTEVETGGRRVDLSEVDLPPDAREVLLDAAQSVFDGDVESAISALDERFPTVCESDRPAPRPADGREVACHLYGGGRPGTAGSRVGASTDD
jgi:peptide/nickel transport system ATP-binding protein